MRFLSRISLWLIAAGLVGRISVVSAQVFWSEHFDDGFIATSNWSSSGTNAGASRWEWSDDSAAGYVDASVPPFGAPSAADGYFLFNSHANHPVPHDVWLENVNRTVDCSLHTRVHMRFYTQYLYYQPTGTVAEVGVSTDGITYHYQPLFEGHPPNLPFEGWVEVPLPWADGQPQVRLRFRWRGNYEYHWKIDDIELFTESNLLADACQTAYDLSPLFRQPPGAATTSLVFDNTQATVADTDPAVFCWEEGPAGEPDFLDGTLWFTFVGELGRFEIQTVPCTAGNYIGTDQGIPGNTQMLLLTGDDCTKQEVVACSDDYAPQGIVDRRAGMVVALEAGRRYYLMVDGFRGSNGPAKGEFCIQVTRIPEVSCAQGNAGSFFVGHDGMVCLNAYVEYYVGIDTATFTLPTEGDVFGLAWCLTSEPIPTDIWPGDVPGVISTVFYPTVRTPAFRNDGNTVPFGLYYLTPVVLGRGSLLHPGAATVANTRPDSSGCFWVGTSTRVVLLPTLPNLQVAVTVTPETVPPGNNGVIELQPSGGAAQYLNDPTLYRYFWEHGPTERVLTQLAQGAYTFWVADAGYCVPALSRTVWVDRIVGVTEAARPLSFSAYPNPVGSALWVQLELSEPAEEVVLELLSPLGQLVERRRLRAAEVLSERFEVEVLPPGTYCIRLFVDGTSTTRRVVIYR